MTTEIKVTLDITATKKVAYSAIRKILEGYIAKIECGECTLEELKDEMKRNIQRCEQEITLAEAEEILRIK